MGFFARGGGQDDGEQSEALARIEAGGIPALASSLTGGMQRGWRLGRLGLPYKVSGGSDVERRGWVITMHAAGTAIKSAGGSAASPEVKTSMRMRS